MQLDPDALADVVVQSIETALGPLLERMAAFEARLSTLGDLRDRVVTVETKAAAPVVLPDIPDVVGALVPLQERMAALEERVSALRVEVDGDDARHELHEAALQRDGETIKERLGAVEIKMATPIAALVDREHEAVLVDLRSRVAGLEGRDISSADIASVRERLAVLETRAPVPGPPGKDGANGRNGIDALGFDDLDAVYDDVGRMSLRFAKGDHVEQFRVPCFVDRGVYKAGTEYVQGDAVTWRGSIYLAQAATTATPGTSAPESRAWRLAVTAGRDGKGIKGEPGIPGPPGPRGPEGQPGGRY